MQRAEGAAQQAEDIAGLPENAVLTCFNHGKLKLRATYGGFRSHGSTPKSSKIGPLWTI